MNEKNIRKYAELMKELELTGLEITEDNRMVRLERSNTAAEPAVIMNPGSIPAGHAVNSAPAGGAAYGTGGTPAADYISIKSPMVGVFYASPAENAEPFASVGDHVEAGKTLCIIEAMKLMNEIHAEHDGVIAEVCVENGQVVEYGTELFRIRR